MQYLAVISTTVFPFLSTLIAINLFFYSGSVLQLYDFAHSLFFSSALSTTNVEDYLPSFLAFFFAFSILIASNLSYQL